MSTENIEKEQKDKEQKDKLIEYTLKHPIERWLGLKLYLTEEDTSNEFKFDHSDWSYMITSEPVDISINRKFKPTVELKAEPIFMMNEMPPWSHDLLSCWTSKEVDLESAKNKVKENICCKLEPSNPTNPKLVSFVNDFMEQYGYSIGNRWIGFDKCNIFAGHTVNIDYRNFKKLSRLWEELNCDVNADNKENNNGHNKENKDDKDDNDKK